MSLRHKLVIVAGVYVVEGFPMGVFADLVPVFLARHDVSLALIGLLSALSYAWVAKVLWSPLIDRYGERRQWITGANLAMAACLLGVAAAQPTPTGLGFLLWACLGIFCLASATQDVAIDAYSIGLCDRGEEGPFNSGKAAAYRVGMLLAGGALLAMPRFIGWSGTFVVAAGLCVAFAIGVRTAPAVPVPEESRKTTLAPLRQWLSQGGALPVFLFAMLFRIGDRAMGPMVKPFWVHSGFSDGEIALVNNTLGIAAIVAGGIVGGIGVARFGIGRSLWAMGIFALASNFGYAAAAAIPETGKLGVYAASLIESFTAGLAGAAFLSYFMRICQKQHAAVQYALLTATYGLTGTTIAIPSGLITEQIGYAAYFALTGLYALPAFFFLPRARRWIGEDRAYSAG